MVVSVLRHGLSFLLPIIGVFFIGALPYLFFSNVQGIEAVARLLQSGAIKNALFLNQDLGLYFNAYLHKISVLMGKILTFSNVEYYESQQVKYLFPTILPYFYFSLKLIVSAFFLSVGAAILFALLIKSLPSRIQKMVRFFFFSLESLPDIFLITMIQYMIILVYRNTGELIMPIVHSKQEPIFLLPVLCLAILPTLFIVRTLLFLLDDEDSKVYVEFARAKGIKYSLILYVHMLRNSLISLFYHTKTIYWLMISTLFIIEYIMAIPGITQFMLNNGPTTPDVVTVSVLLMFVPFYIIFTAISYTINFRLGRNEEEAA